MRKEGEGQNQGPTQPWDAHAVPSGLRRDFLVSHFHLTRSCHTRRIITSVALIKAAAVCPGLSCISRAEVAVIMDVICWPPIEIFTSAIKPLIRTESTRPTS